MLLTLTALVVGSAGDGCDVCAKDQAEDCTLFPGSPVCRHPCGFEWDGKQCVSAVHPSVPETGGGAAPIIGGSGKFRYQYMPNLLVPPAGAAIVNAHGLSVDADENMSAPARVGGAHGDGSRTAPQHTHVRK